MNKIRFEEVSSFKCLGVTFSNNGSATSGFPMWITTATAAMARLDRVCCSHNIRFTTKYNMYVFSCTDPGLRGRNVDTTYRYREENLAI